MKLTGSVCSKLLLLLSIVFFLSCGGGARQSGTISASKGGTLEVADDTSSIYRSKVVFPAGAFSSDTEAAIATADSFLTGNTLAQGPAVLFSPAGTTLEEEATFTIPYTFSGAATELAVEDLIVFLSDNSDINFSASELTIDSSKNTITFDSPFLGTYQVGIVQPQTLAVGEVATIVSNYSGSNGYQLLAPSSGSEEYIISLTSFPSTIVQASPTVSTYTFTIATNEASKSLSRIRARQAPTLEELAKRRELEKRYAARQRVRELERQILERARQGLTVNRSSFNRPLYKDKAADCPDTVNKTCTILLLDVGNGSGGFDDDSQTDYILVNAKVKATSTHSIILIDNDSNYGNDAADDAAATTAANKVTNIFENMIYPRDTALFGAASDVDGNGKIYIFLSSVFDGTGILGFFTLIDTLTNEGSGDSAASNEADVINMVFPDPDGSVSEGLVYATIAHEFQHLINFNQKTLSKLISSSGQTASLSAVLNTEGVNLAESYLNEGFSHFAEDAVGFADFNSGPPEIVYSLLNDIAVSSLVDKSNLVSLDTRALNYLFVRYLYEQAGAATLAGTDNIVYNDGGGITALQQITQNSDVGFKAISNVFPSLDKNGNRSVRSLWNDFILTLYNDGHDSASPGNSSAKYNFIDPYTDPRTGSTVDLVRDSIIGIDLSSSRSQKDTTDTFTLNFPSIVDFSSGFQALSGSLKTASGYYARYGRSSASGNLKISVSSSDGSGIIGQIIRIE